MKSVWTTQERLRKRGSALLTAIRFVLAFVLGTTHVVGLILSSQSTPSLFGFAFAVISSLHSYLILANAGSAKAAEDVGFYYAANAGGLWSVSCCQAGSCSEAHSGVFEELNCRASGIVGYHVDAADGWLSPAVSQRSGVTLAVLSGLILPKL